MSSVLKFKQKTHVFSKGAPDFLLRNCTQYLDARGNPVPITEAYKNTLLGKLK
jgi:magnesium-transporting ATPase (P-type)